MVDIISSIGFRVDSDPLSRANRELDEFARKGNQATRSNKDLNTTTERTSRTMGMLRNALIGVGAAISVRQVLQYADAWKSLNNQLRAVGLSTQEAANTQERLFKIAQDTRSAIGSVGQLYSRLAITATELGASQQQLLQFTEGVGKALAVQGTSATQASGALLQLSQAIGGGTVRAEEFNSLLEGGIVILQTVAKNMDATGGSVAKLRTMVTEGEVSSREFFEAFLAGADELEEKFGQTSVTVGQALTQLNNAFTRFIGNIDESTGASTALASAIQRLAENFDVALAALVGAGGVGLLAAVPRLTGSVIALNAALAANPLVLFAAAVGGAAAAATLFKDELVTVNGEVSSLNAVMKPFIEFIENRIVSTFNIAANAANNLSQGLLFLYNVVTLDFKGAGDNLDQMAESTRRIFEEFQGGVDDVRQLTSSLSGLGRQITDNLDGIDATVDSWPDFTALFTKQISEQERLNNSIGTITVSYRTLDEQLRDIGGTTDDVIAAQELLNDVIQSGKSDTEKYNDAVKEVEAALELLRNANKLTAEEVIRVNEALRDMDPAVQASREAAEKAEAAAEANANEIENIYDRAAENIQRSFTNAFEQMLRGNLTSFKNFANAMLDIFISTVANIASARLFQNISGQVAGAIGAGGGGGAVGNVANIASSLGGIGQLLTGSFSASALTQGSPAFASFMAGIADDLFGANAGAATGNAVLNLTSPAGLAGGLVGGLGAELLFGGNRRGPGTTIGSTIGGIAGSFIPGIGPFLGTALGSFLGGGIGSLFGPKPSRRLEGVEGSLFGPAGGRFFDEDPDDGIQPGGKAAQEVFNAAQNFAQAITEATDTTLDFAGGGGASQFSITSQVNRRTGDPRFTASFGAGGVTKSFSTPTEALDFTFDEIVRRLEGLPADVRTALGNIDFADDIEAGIRDADFVLSFEDTLSALSEGAMSVSEVAGLQAANEIEQTVQRIQEFKDTTARLGLDTEAAAEATRSYVERLVGINQEAGPQSQLQVALETLEGRFGAIGPLLEEVGIGADRASELFQQAVDRLGDDFVTSLEARLNEASGKGFLNRINEALAQRAQDRTTAQDLGLDTNLPGQIFSATVQGIVENVLSGTRTASGASAAVQPILQTFSDLPGVIDIVNQGLAAHIASLEEVEEANDDLVEANDNLVVANDNVTNSVNEAAEALQEYQRTLLTQAQTVDEIIRNQSLDQGLSLISPRQRLSGLQDLFRETVAQAGTGDQDALGRVGRVRADLLEAAQDVFASGPGFQQIFSSSQNLLNLLSGQLEYLADNASIDQFANGGMSAGGLALVGERGPELVNLPGGARVTAGNVSIDTEPLQSRQEAQVDVTRTGFNALINEVRALRGEVARLRRERKMVA